MITKGNKKERDELLSKLHKDGAGCLEMALNGFIRVYEKDEEKCKCKDCIMLDKNESLEKECLYNIPKN